MKKILVIAVSLLFFLGVLAAAVRPPRYVSEWVSIEPGGVHVFEHGLKRQPMIVYVWARSVLLEDVEDVRPWTELPEHPIFIEDVTLESITLENHGVEAWTVQVVAEP